MIYAWHHAVVLAGCVLVGPVLIRCRWTRSFPRTAVATWQLLVLACVAAAVGLLVSVSLRVLELGVAPAVATAGRRPGSFALGPADVAIFATGVALVAALAGVLVMQLLHRRSSRRRHRDLLSVVAQPATDAELIVVDHQTPVVYGVPGRTPYVVASSGALRRLDERQLAAVLHHERRHLREHHDWAVLPFSVLSQLRRFVPALGRVEAEVRLLLEMAADDQAVRAGLRGPLISALSAFDGRSGWDSTPDDLDHRRRRLASTPRRSALHRLGAVSCAATALLFISTTGSLFVLPI